METRVYDVSDLVLPPSSYPFEGMYIPEARGGRVGAGGGMEGVSGLGSSGGGLGTVAVGGMGGMVAKEGNGTGSGMGAGMFAVVEPFHAERGKRTGEAEQPCPAEGTAQACNSWRHGR